MEYDVGLLIGRFQPFHQGHLALLQTALEQAQQVLVVLGSAFAARTSKNPFTWQERAEMIKTCLNQEQKDRVRFVPMRDYYDEQRWTDAVRSAVQKAAPQAQKVALIGHFKDNSSQYLSQFPHWQLHAMGRMAEIDATRIRQIYFEAEDMEVSLSVLASLVPLPVRQYLRAWSLLAPYAQLQIEHKMVQEYHAAWASAPYPPIFSTVDAVVKAGNHVLLVQRGQFPGKGLWALPGGFVEQDERLLTSAIRELQEETRLGVLESSLYAAFVQARVFDHPQRSLRGRTITHAHFFDLQTEQLPDIEGADDAFQARWVNLQELAGMEAEFFDDHFHILDHFFKISLASEDVDCASGSIC